MCVSNCLLLSFTLPVCMSHDPGGVGDLKYPLVSDLKKEISEAYGVLTQEGVALRGLFIIDREGVVQHATINNLAFGRNVDETIRILQVRLQFWQGPLFESDYSFKLLAIRCMPTVR